MGLNKQVVFNEVSSLADSTRPFDGLTYAIRTDADYATRDLKENIINHVTENPDKYKPGTFDAGKIRKITHSVYRDWGHNSIKAIAQHLDYDSYGLHSAEQQNLRANLYNAGELAQKAKENAQSLVNLTGKTPFNFGLNTGSCLSNIMPGAIDLRAIAEQERQHIDAMMKLAEDEMVQSGKDLLSQTIHKPNGAEDHSVNIHPSMGSADSHRILEDANSLVAENTTTLLKKTTHSKSNAIYVSLDSMINYGGDDFSEIAFSRLFTLDGKQQDSYVARPGSKELTVQIKDLCEKAVAVHSKLGRKADIVLIEDNVRHARMLNWFIGQLEQTNLFDNANLAGISTCFCSASPEEQKKIRHNEKIVPVVSVIDFADTKVDVTTPRDLLWDGFVVDLDGTHTRIPGIFTDVSERFKIKRESVDQFRTLINQNNMRMLDKLSKIFRVDIPLDWFTGADVISHVSGHPRNTPMREIIEKPVHPFSSRWRGHDKKAFPV